MSDTSTLEIVQLDVDLSLEVPCEGVGHDHPADVRIRAHCDRCKATLSEAICWPIYDRITSTPVMHTECSHQIRPKDIVVVSVLRPR